MKPTFAYFGDGVYAEYDGYGFTLRANGHDREHGATDEIYIEPSVLMAINTWANEGHMDHQTGKRFGEHK